MATLANTPSRAWVITAIRMRVTPYAMVIRIGAAISQPNHDAAATGAVPFPTSASVAHLKVKGTATVASLANTIKIIATITRRLRSRRSAGQI